MGLERQPYTPLLFFFTDTATTELYTLSLHDALPLSNRSRNNSWTLRIDSLSAGIPFPRCWAKGASLPSVENCRRRGPLHRHAALITSTGFDDHDRPESVITFHRIG